MWAIAGLSMDPRFQGRDPGAYIIAGMIGGAVLISLGAQERRIRELEGRLHEGTSDRAQSIVASDPDKVDTE